MTTLYLVRHGETDWNLEGRWQGQADVPMNAHGRQQVTQVAEKLSNVPFTAIYTSDLQRAANTAYEIASTNGALPSPGGQVWSPPGVILDPRLREIHQGEWQGMLVQEIEARYAEDFKLRREDPLSVRPPGGESAQEVLERVVAAIADILAIHPQGNIAVVSHGFTIAVMLAHFYKISFDRVWELVPGNGDLTVLRIDQPSEFRNFLSSAG
jgi:broad specificity phosphatase PhoE